MALLSGGALLLAAPLQAQAAPDTAAQPAPDAPASLLPEGFDEPATTTAAPLLPGTVAAVAPDGAGESTDAAFVAPVAPDGVIATMAAVDPFATAAMGRSLAVAGPLTAAVTGPGAGYGLNTFAGSNGRYVAGLMRRLETPIASRWAHIVLRRALLTESLTPPDVNSGDWVAERAWLLIRLGEIDGAKALVDAVPLDRFSRKLYLVAGQAALAAADLPGLCPLAPTALALSTDPLWRIANAICAGMTGDDITAANEFDRLRDADTLNDFDLLLAERVATLSGTGGRAANLDWTEIDALTPYRFGLATAAGLKTPPELLAAMPLMQSGWILRAPGLATDVRGQALRKAAVLGVASAQEMVNFAGAESAGADAETFASSPAASLRAAYVATKPADRIGGMRALWEAGEGADAFYAAQIETALAAAAFPVDKRFADDAPLLIGAMLSAGADRAALRWWTVVEGAGRAPRDIGWALLAAADPGRDVPVTPDRFRDWAAGLEGNKASARHRAALLLAGLGGLGKAGSDWNGLRSDYKLENVNNSWEKAIAAAARAGRSGEVIVLAASALQGKWEDVPPAHFERLIAALVAVGRGHEARMMVAEAVMRS
ncbi:MAG: hypothetical protein ACRCUI_04145 [Polymorphobacter sp.]